MPRKDISQAPPKLDAYEVEVVEKSVFGESASGRAERDVEELLADIAGQAVDRSDGAGAPAVPEADRLFAPPSAEQAQRALRELEWGEHITGMRVAAARGNTTTYLYSLEEAAAFFLDEKSGGASLGTNGAFAWIDTDAFVAWLRDAVGDQPFADVLERKLAGLSAYNDKVETLRNVLMLRMSQYAPYLHGRQEGEAQGE